MTTLPPISTEYIKDESVNSEKRTKEAVEILFKILLLSNRRGRPRKNIELEDSDAA